MIGANTSKIETNVTMTGMMMGICKIQSTKLLAVLIEIAHMKKEYFYGLMHFFPFNISVIRWDTWKSSKNMDRENSFAKSLTKVSLSLLQIAV